MSKIRKTQEQMDSGNYWAAMDGPIVEPVTGGEVLQNSWAEYCDIKRMNPSTLVAGRKSMKRLKTAIDWGYREETDDMRLGTGIHALTLEPDRFEESFVIMPDFANHPDNFKMVGKKTERSNSAGTKWAQERKAEFAAANTAKTVLTATQYYNALYAIEAINSHHSAPALIQSHSKEQTVLAVINDVDCKGRLDLLGDYIIDLKTTASVDPQSFGRIFGNLGYAFKLAFYRELVAKATGIYRNVKVIAQEVSGEFDTVVYDVPGPILDNAISTVFKVLDQYKECRDSGVWHGVDRGADSLPIHLPNWAMDEDEMLETFTG